MPVLCSGITLDTSRLHIATNAITDFMFQLAANGLTS